MTKEIEEFLTKQDSDFDKFRKDRGVFMTVEDYRQMADSGKFDIKVRRNKKEKIVSVSFIAKELPGTWNAATGQFVTTERF